MFFGVHSSHGDDATLQRGRGQRINQRSLQNLQRGGNRQGNDRDDCGLSADHRRKDRSRPRGEDRFQGQGQDHLLGKENHAETKKVQSKDREGQTLEQELSSLLVQELMHENEELRNRLDAMSQSQQPPRAQPVQQVVDPKQNMVPTLGEFQLADGSRPRRLRGKQYVDRLPPSVSISCCGPQQGECNRPVGVFKGFDQCSKSKRR